MMKTGTILIAGEELLICQGLIRALRLKGYNLVEAQDQPGALHCLRHQKPSLLVAACLARGPEPGCELAQSLREHDPLLPIILLVQHSSEASAIAALKMGVRDYFRTPFQVDEVLASISRCLSSPPPFLPTATSSLNPPFGPGRNDREDGLGQFVGRSHCLSGVKAYIRQVAPSDSTVLITGETGTGKERVAELMHQLSGRHRKPFVCINCAALPDALLESELFGFERGAFTGAHAAFRGKMDQAHAGTIFFDEIGDMTLRAQTAILRAIETKHIQRLGGRETIAVDVRIIAATNQDLDLLVSKKQFRKDLFYRLNVARIHLQPLRERKEDIPLLLDHYLRAYNARFHRDFEAFEAEDLALLLNHDWPGNVRELKNFVEASFITAPPGPLRQLRLPEALRSVLAVGESLPGNERDRLISALLSTNWNVSKAAHQLHWSRMTLYRKMAKYQFTRAHFSENFDHAHSHSHPAAAL